MLPGLRVVDPIAVGLLRNWARHPWLAAVRLELVDRFEEMGLLRLAEQTRTLGLGTGSPVAADGCRQPRRARQRLLREWRSILHEHYGDFESDPLPCEAPADTSCDDPLPF